MAGLWRCVPSGRRCWLALLTLFACGAGHAAPSAMAWELVTGSADAPQALRIAGGQAQPIAVPQTTPLGSVWKLFVYAYLVDQNRPAPEYRCTGRDRNEESYCCSPGETIGRDAALVQSCGLFFEPGRLQLDAAAWSRYWQARAAPRWLQDVRQLEPATQVPVQSLMQALSAIDERTRAVVMRTLQRVTLQPRARPLLSVTGSQLRVKTWSWHDAQGKRIGGFAGWLADGTPVWVRGPGTSATVLEQIAPQIARYLPTAVPADDACVSVRFFNRYALQQVWLDEQPARVGALRGAVRVRFQNGQELRFSSDGALQLRQESGVWVIEGRMGLNNYIARVIEREAAPEPLQAARALAVAVRTYLVRHADFVAGCYRITDDSRTQRVSPHAPSRASLGVARWSDGLVLNGVDGRYHLSQAKPQQLAWQSARRDALVGHSWDQILQAAYGSAGFGLMGEADAAECQPLRAAEAWLASREPLWRRQLQAMPGFAIPQPRPRVCRLQHGNPYADIGRGRIYAAGVATENDRLTLAHEYLHFALEGHPRGRDEDYVERTARQLMGHR